jgi:hypothetical protein
MEVRLANKLFSAKHKCIYCGLSQLQQRPMISLPELKVNQELLKCSSCKKTFHVRCAIKRGLITAFEIMTSFQSNSVTGAIFIFCSTHTKVKRDLPDVDDMVSNKTDMMSVITGMTGFETEA